MKNIFAKLDIVFYRSVIIGKMSNTKYHQLTIEWDQSIKEFVNFIKTN